MNLYFRLVGMLLTRWRHRRISVWDGSTYSSRVWPSDLDTVGHMNNAKYFGLMDLGRVDLMLRSRMHKQFSGRGWYSVVAAQTIRYRRSLKPGQRFVLRTTLLGTDEKALYFQQTFKVGGELYAQAVVQARVLRKDGGSVPAAEVIEALEPGPLVPDLTLPQWVQDWAVGVRQTGHDAVA
ncbi:acyl-CoA thioesterase [Nocardioides campestrisoli]|uniref:acyl-CoA thioesterase n=1 Tax=Nocardioides campestrisoli TaxID=2736757 RepID=UPI0015E6944F|nr:acyl-CoA thioesterase [Nocardioides campestrisoli]